MSKTLFFYLFKDLVRIFLMASGALAGIMSFAGLLRPLTENGLDLGQVSKILRYMSPAMTTYSLPVAALFAATVVYGRFSSDNELTAMRAGGISYLSARRFSIALPALVLGLMVSLISLLLLCFIVPIYTLKVEEVIYSNIAKVIASKIEKNHEVDFRNGTDEMNVFAQGALQLPFDPRHPDEQRVELFGPAIMSYDNSDPDMPDLAVPKEFYMAGTAVITITRNQGEERAASLRVRLIDGLKFPRAFAGDAQAGVAETAIDPMVLPSMINENVKFMTERNLIDLHNDPSKSEKVQVVLREITRREQEVAFLWDILNQINRRDETNQMGAQATCTLSTAAIPPNLPDSYTVSGEQITARFHGSELIISGLPGGDGRNVRFRQTDGLRARSNEIHIRVHADALNKQMAVSIELYDTELHTGDVVSPRTSFVRTFDVPMTPQIYAIQGKPLSEYPNDKLVTGLELLSLHHEQLFVNNAVLSELHSRAAFSMSCLVLVMVGCALGVMFRSGNFLTAFAVSFVPALLVITLIVCGQQIATHIPYPAHVEDVIRDPLHTGLWFIWIGNFGVLAAAIYLTGKLQRR